MAHDTRDANLNRQSRPVKYGRMTNAQVTQAARNGMSRADFGYAGNERGNEADDRINREAYPARLAPRAAYASIVGEPVQLAPADFVGARAYVTRIEAAIEHGGWTRNEWRRLHTLLTKWRSRASGADIRFNEVGNRQGGLTKRDAAHIGTRKYIRGILK